MLLSVIVVVAFGVSFGALADRWVAGWPEPALTLRGSLAVLPFLGVLAMSVPVVMPAVVMVAAVSVAVCRRPGGRLTRLLERSERPGRLAVGVVAALGTVWVGLSAAQVLAL